MVAPICHQDLTGIAEARRTEVLGQRNLLYQLQLLSPQASSPSFPRTSQSRGSRPVSRPRYVPGDVGLLVASSDLQRFSLRDYVPTGCT